MFFINNSSYDTDELKALFEFAVQGINMEGVGVEVLNARSRRTTYRALAYSYRERRGTFAKSLAVSRMIRIWIGAPERFPTTNMHTQRKWRHVRKNEIIDPNKSYRWYWNGDRRYKQVYDIVTHPYGGKKSPLITMETWQEAFVSVSAHEAKHIEQYRNKSKRSEIECERWASYMLERYKAKRDRIQVALMDTITGRFVQNTRAFNELVTMELVKEIAAHE